MFFIVDGNKANSFQCLMNVLQEGKFKEKVNANERMLVHGEHRGVGYSVFLKEQNRGKRDSQWLFVEILRNMVPAFKPNYVFVRTSDVYIILTES
jgi:cellulose synthase/poly-beta-1,6-N-acetylglucosamine synthase-like glycosyltransferase